MGANKEVYSIRGQPEPFSYLGHRIEPAKIVQNSSLSIMVEGTTIATGRMLPLASGTPRRAYFDSPQLNLTTFQPHSRYVLPIVVLMVRKSTTTNVVVGKQRGAKWEGAAASYLEAFRLSLPEAVMDMAETTSCQVEAVPRYRLDVERLRPHGDVEHALFGRNPAVFDFLVDLAQAGHSLIRLAALYQLERLLRLRTARFIDVQVEDSVLAIAIRHQRQLA